eukprot:3835524-Pleurochrysis_carterae.AAC.1
MVRYFGTFCGRPSGTIEGERLLARFGIVGRRRYRVRASGTFAPPGRAACRARCEQRSWLAVAERVSA